MIEAKPVILCGGTGSRLWPMSRFSFPKQFLNLIGDNSLFQQSAKRLMTLGCSEINVEAPIIVTGEEHRFLALEQLRNVGIDFDYFLLEPVGRNTAPALTLAALASVEDGCDPVLVVSPADQNISDIAAFKSAMSIAIREAAAGGIVVLGVVPDSPETGYGYIKANKDASKVSIVEFFVEKPDLTKAKEFLRTGGYYWNAGFFVLKASVWLKAIKRFRQDIAKTTQLAWKNRSIDADFMRPSETDYRNNPSQSVDYAVIEHCPRSDVSIKMVPLSAGWSDLGAWDSVWKTIDKDGNGNANLGDVISKDSFNTMVQARSRLVAVVGVRDLVIVETEDAVLVADKSSCQDVKSIVDTLNAKNRNEHAFHRKVHRPWGWYDNIDQGNRFKVKRILVKPGASLSLQRHEHRAEHWIVVSGIAEITNGLRVFTLKENESTYIPLGEIHRLSNPGNQILEIIEVQSGEYLGEDDIIRIDDKYGRKQ